MNSEELDKFKLFAETRRLKKAEKKAAKDSKPKKKRGRPSKKAIAEAVEIELQKKSEQAKGHVSRQNKNKSIVWKPFPAKEGQRFSSQEMFLNVDHIDQVLYTGSRYIGKSDALVAAYVKHVGKGFNERWRGVIVRRTYKALQDILKKAKKIILNSYPEGSDNPAKFLAGDQMKFIWKSGEELHFRSCKSEAEYEDKFHGQEYPFIGIDELTSWEDSTVYDSLMSCNRTDFLEDEVNPPVIMRSTTNPSGKGRNWVKKYFIDPSPIGTMITDSYDFEGDIITNTRVAIQGNWSENPYADKKYIAKLFKLEQTDFPRFRAWLFGDWDVVLGGMFGDLWQPQVHILEPFTIPKSFHIDRSYDDGTTDPFSCLFWAECLSDTVIMNGDKKVNIPANSLILVNEIYGADPKNPNKGLLLNTKKIGQMILDKEASLLNGGWFNEHHKVNGGNADYMIWAGKNVRGKKTVADKFTTMGIKWKKSKKHGDKYGRVASVRIFQDMLLASTDEDTESPHFYVFNTCRNFISNVINLQRDEANPDDIDQSQPDHDWDACRYRVTQKNS